MSLREKKAAARFGINSSFVLIPLALSIALGCTEEENLEGDEGFDNEMETAPDETSIGGLSIEQREAYEEQAALLEQAIEEMPSDIDPEIKASLQSQLDAVDDLLMGLAPTGEGDIQTQSYALTGGDGCSAPWYANVLLGVIFQTPASFFNDTCVYHDRCYTSGVGTYNLSRQTADDTWLSKMQKKCDSSYPAWLRILIPSTNILWAKCQATASTMHAAVRAYGEPHFWKTPCIGGQKWPVSGAGPGCSSYEVYDSSRTRVCNGVSSGMRADGSIGSNWRGCRGSGCWACTDALKDYPNYFKNNPLCSKNTTCAGRFYTCGSACPPPTAADR